MAASYGRAERLVGSWMPRERKRFFLATKTGERTREAAAAQIRPLAGAHERRSVDLLQLHNLVDPDEWATALGPGGALEAAIEARERGQVRFIGVTGHGTTVAAQHMRSLERFPFDSVLLPYNVTMMQNASYARDFEELSKVCGERGIAMQTIKGITLGPWDEKEHTTTTWYEPLQEQRDIDMAVDYVLGRAGRLPQHRRRPDAAPARPRRRRAQLREGAGRCGDAGAGRTSGDGAAVRVAATEGSRREHLAVRVSRSPRPVDHRVPGGSSWFGRTRCVVRAVVSRPASRAQTRSPLRARSPPRISNRAQSRRAPPE